MIHTPSFSLQEDGIIITVYTNSHIVHSLLTNLLQTFATKFPKNLSWNFKVFPKHSNLQSTKVGNTESLVCQSNQVPFIVCVNHYLLPGNPNKICPTRIQWVVVYDMYRNSNGISTSLSSDVHYSKIVWTITSAL